MPPNPEYHNGKLPEDSSFVNGAFTGDDSHHSATPSADATFAAASAATTVAVIPPGSPLTANGLTNRRNSNGNNQNGKSQTVSLSHHPKHDPNNNKPTGGGHKNGSSLTAAGNNDNKAMSPTCGSAPEEPLMDFDDLLPYIGEFGRYQKILFLLMIPFAFFVAWTYFSQIFLTLVPQEFHCALPPELDVLVPSPEARRSIGIPIDMAKSTPDQVVYDRCTMFAVNFTEMLARYENDVVQLLEKEQPNQNWPRQACLNGYWFNYTDIPYETAATQFGWVCENDTYGTWATSIFFVGAIVGGLLFGWVADRYGRVPALVACNVTGFVGGIATAFVSNFWQFCFCRFLVGFAFDNCFTMMYILVLEYVGPKWRTFVANMSIAIFFTFASCLLPWMALGLANWRYFAIAVSAPLILAVLTPFCVPESARWLVSQGQTKRAMTILRKFARINRKPVDETVFRKFEADCEELRRKEEELLTEASPDGTKKRRNYSILDLFRSPHLCKITVVLIVIWMMISLVFDGHVRNVDNLGMDLFVTFTIASVTEFPADTFLTLTLDRWGRRWLAFGTMVMSGLFSLLATTVPVGLVSATFAILGRFSVNISYNIGLQYAAELLPTVVRAQGVAFIHIMGYIAQMIAPFVVYLAQIQQNLPLIILGFMGVIGGCLSLLLPETLDKELPQTLQDGEEFGKDQKFFDFPCISRKPAQLEAEENAKDEVAQRKKDGLDARLKGDPESPFKRFNSDLTRSSARVSLRAFNRGEFQSSLLRRSSRPQTPQLPH